MDKTRQLVVNKTAFSGKSVVYVMARDQRVQDNHALLAAQELALEHKVPLYVVFILKKTANRSKEHYQFMLDGLKLVGQALENLNIHFVLRTGNTKKVLNKLVQELKPGAVIFDFSPLARPRDTIKEFAHTYSGIVNVVDTHNCIPVWVASDTQEFAAHTMRRKVHQKLQDYLTEPQKIISHPHTAKVLTSSFDEAQRYIEGIHSSGIQLSFGSGESAAHQQLRDFIATRLENYAIKRNNIVDDFQSNLSPFLHFGQISSLRVALEVIKAVNKNPLLFEEVKLASAGDTPSTEDGMNALLEEMIVRKELSDNFCFYAKDYTSLESAPQWAKDTLSDHKQDAREFTYTRGQWEEAKTHDEPWNAAQKQLIKTGKIHGYMRMYWAKKLLEFSESPEEALRIGIYLNDKYSIDGGDPNGYVGLLWSIAGLHDRPWFERPVYGKIRYMNEAGLRTKFNVDEYIGTWN